MAALSKAFAGAGRTRKSLTRMPDSDDVGDDREAIGFHDWPMALAAAGLTSDFMARDMR